jgi:hypothetical protein
MVNPSASGRPTEAPTSVVAPRFNEEPIGKTPKKISVVISSATGMSTNE